MKLRYRQLRNSRNWFKIEYLKFRETFIMKNGIKVTLYIKLPIQFLDSK